VLCVGKNSLSVINQNTSVFSTGVLNLATCFSYLSALSLVYPYFLRVFFLAICFSVEFLNMEFDALSKKGRQVKKILI
jgi:hypothetical protein